MKTGMAIYRPESFGTIIVPEPTVGDKIGAALFKTLALAFIALGFYVNPAAFAQGLVIGLIALARR